MDLGFNEGEGDEWPAIVDKIRKANIVIFATPIWWGGRSSLMQRVIERMDAFDEESIAGGRAELLNKVAGIIITGSEDGAQATMAGIMEVLTFMNFTLPPQCAAYWVGEVGEDPKTDRERRIKKQSHAAYDPSDGKKFGLLRKSFKRIPTNRWKIIIIMKSQFLEEDVFGVPKQYSKNFAVSFR